MPRLKEVKYFVQSPLAETVPLASFQSVTQVKEQIVTESGSATRYSEIDTTERQMLVGRKVASKQNAGNLQRW